MPTDPKPVDLAAIKEIVSIWRLIQKISLASLVASLIIMAAGGVNHDRSLLVVGLGIGVMTIFSCAIISAILLLRVASWHDQRTEAASKAPPSDAPADVSA